MGCSSSHRQKPKAPKLPGDGAADLAGAEVHVADLGALLAVAITRDKRRIDVVRFRQFGQQRIVRRHPACTMQEHQRRAGTALEIANRDVVGRYGFQVHAQASTP